MSKDQMQDVFAANFDFKKGEQPTSEKLSGWVKQTDSAFSDITKAVGDPWMYQSHGSKKLSPQELAQASLARIIGPSDWLSPHGASFNESCNVTITLSANRNSWSLGYPLVAITNTLTPTSSVQDSIATLESIWDTSAVVFGGANNATYFATRKDNPEDVTTDGDYYVDFYGGIITSYLVPLNNITLTINGLYMFGPGIPWGSANVIPTWSESSRCTVVPGTVTSGEQSYTIQLPAVSTGTRSTGLLKGTEGPNVAPYDVSYGVNAPGADSSNAKYRLPYSIISTFSPGEDIPEGFMLIWDGSRIVPNVRFKTLELGSTGTVDPYNIQAITLENVLTGLTVRIIITGSSIAEAVNYLMYSNRSNTHTGLNDGQDGKTLAFNAPISHKSIADRFGGSLPSMSTIDSSISDTAFRFKESVYPTNDHPQYLHRAGYMSEDADGNSGNAMRGDIVFSSTEGYGLGVDGYSADTYGIKFGGGDSTAASLSFTGGILSSNILGFGIDGVGIIKTGSSSLGTVAFKPYNDMPLYIKSSSTDEYNSGASIAFDYLNASEMNYIKINKAMRSGSNDPINLPANTAASSAIWNIVTPNTKGLSNRISMEQLREWRFRSVSKVTSASNDGLTTDGAFDNYFTSPGIVGADFFNVYSNAIFFSEQGDGRITSLHEHGEDWLKNNLIQPTGIYYSPNFNGTGQFQFVSGNATGSSREKVAAFSRSDTYLKTYYGDISRSSILMNPDPTQTYGITLNTTLNSIKLDSTYNINLEANEDINLIGNNTLYISDFSSVNSTAASFIANASNSVNLSGNYGGSTSNRSRFDLNSDGTFSLKAHESIGESTISAYDLSLSSYGELNIEPYGDLVINAHTIITFKDHNDSGLNMYFKNLPNIGSPNTGLVCYHEADYGDGTRKYLYVM